MSLTTLAPILHFLRSHAPFDAMAPDHLELLASRLKLAFYARGEVILSPEDGPATRLYIIKQGRVRGESPDVEENNIAWELVTGEAFPVGALLSRRPTRLINRAAEDTFCFELERNEFDHLIAQSVVFHDFCTRRIANLLDNALRNAQTHSANRISQESSLSAPLHTLLRRAPVCCSPQTSLSDALQQMQQAHVGSIAITGSKGEFLGILTLRDLLGRVVLPQISLATAIGDVMTPQPLSLNATAQAWEAALMMAREGFGHLGVVDGVKLIGIISERNLFALQRVGLVNLSRSISRADDLATLKHLQMDVHQMVEQMLAQGASVEQITKIITTLNDSTTQRVITLLLASEGIPATPFTWLAFGSEGRHEQTLKTDQDNGIIFLSQPGHSDEEIRSQLLPLARRINETLADIGFPLCPGQIMASNPECCLSVEEWKHRFSRWLEQGSPEHLLNATIFFDFRPLWGDELPANELRDWLNGEVATNRRFLHMLAANALGNRPPLGLVRDFVVSSTGEQADTLDLKLQGLTPFVNGARLLALAGGISETNTARRLDACATSGQIPRAEAAAWHEAYHFIQLLRMRHHQQQERQGQDVDNRIDPDELNELDRRILKESFRQARKLQQRIALDYGL